MAQSPILDFLAGPVLTELMTAMDVRRGLPDYWPKELFKPSSQKPFGTKAIWNHRTGQRQASTIVGDMAPSRQYNPPTESRSEVTCVTSKEHIVIDAETLIYLKANVPVLADRAKRKLVQDLKDFKVRFDNLRNAAVGSIFGFGKLSYLPAGAGTAPDNAGGVPTGGGQIVISGTSNAVVVDPGLTYGGSNALAKTSVIPNTPNSAVVGDWSNASTNIPGSLRSFFDGFIKTNNYVPRHILYGRDVPNFLISNTAMQTFLSRQPSLNDELMTTNEVPKGLLDFNWHPAYRDYFVDYNGVVQPYVAPNQIVIYPEPDESWYELVEGGSLVPTGLVPPNMSAETALEQSKIVNGYASYSDWTNDPYSVKVIAIDSFIPLIKVQTAVWSATLS